MSTQPPLDLDAIRERLQEAGICSDIEMDADALISEVEALRQRVKMEHHTACHVCTKETNGLGGDPDLWPTVLHLGCLRALKAKLERAKEALCWSLERLVDCKNCCGYGGVTIEAIEERQHVLAELDKP